MPPGWRRKKTRESPPALIGKRHHRRKADATQAGHVAVAHDAPGLVVLRAFLVACCSA